MQAIADLLNNNRDDKYAEFQRRLLPTVEPTAVIGVRTPILRAMAKSISREEYCEDFLSECPHTFFEENQLHGFIISGIRDFDKCVAELERFLPYMDNWATCDQTSPKVFKRHRAELLPYIDRWLTSSHTYTVRFAIGMLMQHYLDEDFKAEYLDRVAQIRSEEYYINTEIAWYMATALAKQWTAAVVYIENGVMGRQVHNKTIQKAVESYRISDERKIYLKKFRQRAACR